MLRNYLLIAWRNLKRHKVFSAINVLGLSIGMAACLLILQYVTYQLSFDRFHANAPRLYRVVLGKDVPGRWVTPPALAPMLKPEFPQVALASRLQGDGGVVSVGQTVFNEGEMCWVDPSFLTMFSFPLSKGNPRTALARPNTAVISPAIARKYFGSTDPMGKVFQFNGERTFQVTGVLKELPPYSHLQFDFLLSYVTPRDAYFEKEWDGRGFLTYVLLTPRADPKDLEAALPGAVKKYTKETKELADFWLQPLRDIHASSVIKESEGVDPAMLYFLGLLAGFILLIAWINYINLSTAKATQRAKEVGVRKAMGAGRYQLFRQFLLEAILLNGIAVVVAFTLVQLALPSFRGLTGLALSLTLWNDGFFWLALAGMLGLGTALSGAYPALVLSSFKPIAVLKGAGVRVALRKGIRLRQALVVFQFATCTGLIIGTGAVYLQTDYMRNQDLGIDIEQTLVINGPQLVSDSTTRANRWQLFKQAVRETGAVRGITASDDLPSKGFDNYTSTSVVGNPLTDNTKRETYAMMGVEADFFSTFGLSLLAGRTFSGQRTTDTRTVVLNQEASRRLGFANPQQAIGRQLEMEGKYTIIGVIRNYHHDQLKKEYFPTLLLFDPTPNGYFSLKIGTGERPTEQVKKTLAKVEAQWKRLYPGNPFEYFFLDESFQAQYQADQQLGRTVAFFAFLTIFVACLGLFGLASFTTTQRTKEIGIRKVLGATLSNVLFLLSKDFLKLVLLANLIAWPLAYWGIRKWLENYAFDFQVNPWLFIVPASVVLLIALLTVGYQTWQAARQNPVKALRYE
ncbi:MAG: ABC transporter permease [Ferruginibacter sp.]|nr:ABC transporter permease [Cytophagales bacterium]